MSGNKISIMDKYKIVLPSNYGFVKHSNGKISIKNYIWGPGPFLLNFTGWHMIDDRGPPIRKVWFLNNVEASAIEVFDSLTDEQKLEIIFNLDEWK